MRPWFPPSEGSGPLSFGPSDVNRLERVLSFFSGAPSSNGNGVKLADPPIEQKATATQAASAAIAASAAWFAPADFIPVDSKQGTLEVRDHHRALTASVLCHAAMRYRATKLAEAPMFVAEQTDEGEAWLPNHPLAGLLQFPNADEEMADLLEGTSMALDSTGMVIWVIDPDSAGRPGRLSSYSADEFTVKPVEGRLYGRFDLTTSRGTRELQPEQVVFFRLPHPTDRWRGLAPVHVVSRQLGIESQILRAIVAGINNTIVPGFTLQFPKEMQLTPEQLDEFKAKVSADYTNARNHGKFFATNAEPKKHQLGFGGLEGGALYREIEAAVCVAFGVRPEILAMMIGLENAPWSHMQTAQRLSYDETIIPLWARIARTVTRQLLRLVDKEASHLVRFDTSKVRALQADLLADARRSVLLRGIATRNQRRQIAGLEPETNDAAFWDAVEERMPAAENEPDIPKRSHRQSKAEVSDDVRRLIFDEVTRAQEFAWEIAAIEQLDQDKQAALSILQSAKAASGTAETKDPPPPIGPADAETIRRLIREIADHMDLEAAVRWTAAMTPLVESAGRRAVERIAADVGVSFDLLQPGLSEFTQKEAAWLVTQVTDTTKQAIRDALTAGLVEGESVPDLAKRIQESGAFARSRAELIARTETVRVTNGGQTESLSAYQRDSGDRITKRWLATQDSRVRDSHRAMNGETRGVDEEFSNGLQHPGEPNCRCTLVFEMEAAA